MDAKLCTVANKMPQLQGLELHAMCFVFKTAVVFLCKERLRQKKKSLIVSLTKKIWQNPNNQTNFLLFKGELKQVFRSWGGDYSLSGIDSRVSRPSSRLSSSFLTKKNISRHGKIFLLMQVLIPVTEVQVRASNPKDVDSHYLWELIHLKSQIQRRNEKVYHLSNRWEEDLKSLNVSNMFPAPRVIDRSILWWQESFICNHQWISSNI